jgi:hypothetical protein
LSSVTSIRIAVVLSTAPSSIGSREERSKSPVSLNTQSVIVSFGGSMSPAGSAVGLVSYVSDHTGTLGPLHSGVESFGGLYSQKIGLGFDGCSRLPERVDDGSHHLFDLGLSHLLESGGLLGLPGGVGSVDLFGNGLQVQLFITDQLGSAKAQHFAVLLGAQHLGHFVREVLVENRELAEQR